MNISGRTLLLLIFCILLFALPAPSTAASSSVRVTINFPKAKNKPYKVYNFNTSRFVIIQNPDLLTANEAVLFFKPKHHAARRIFHKLIEHGKRPIDALLIIYSLLQTKDN